MVSQGGRNRAATVEGAFRAAVCGRWYFCSDGGWASAVRAAALPAFSRSFELAGSEGGLLVSAQWVGAAIGVAVMFLRADQITPRLALALMAAGAAVMAAALVRGLTLLGAVVFGIGYGASTVVDDPLFLRAFGDRGPAMVGP